MSQHLPVWVALLVPLACAPSAALACTTFLLERDGRVLIGKSYDWDDDGGMVIVNKRGVAKHSPKSEAGEHLAQWTSKYASLTFNQYGREFPNGGMNEAGLVAEIMWLDESVYPPPDHRPVLDELSWIQYQLDNFGSVDEAVKHAEEVRVSGGYGKVHYLLCDRTAACAAFEYLAGRLVVTAGDQLPIKTLTNNTYAASLADIKGHRGFGGAAPTPNGNSSLARFDRASALTRGVAKANETEALRILDRVNVGERSVWNIVYDPIRLQVWFRTRSHRTVKHVDLAPFTMDCESPVKVIDINTTHKGDVTSQFVDYTPVANQKRIELSMRPLLHFIPQSSFDTMIAYPQSLGCATASNKAH